MSQSVKIKVCSNLPLELKPIELLEEWDLQYECDKCIYCYTKEIQRRYYMIKKYNLPDYMNTKPKCVKKRFKKKQLNNDDYELMDDNKENLKN
jgi:hypothetical protein